MLLLICHDVKPLNPNLPPYFSHEFVKDMNIRLDNYTVIEQSPPVSHHHTIPWDPVLTSSSRIYLSLSSSVLLRLARRISTLGSPSAILTALRSLTDQVLPSAVITPMLFLFT